MINYPIPIRSSDGYTFYILTDGRVVDNLDPEREDMTWSDLDSFIESQKNVKLVQRKIKHNII